MIFKKLFQLREGDQPKPFLDHLEDLRWMLVKTGLTLFLSMIVCFGFRHQLAHLAQKPLADVNPELPAMLVTLSPTDSITISLKLAFYAGIILSFPLLLFFLAEFVLPALTAKEKRFVLPGIAVGFGLFLLGVLASYHWVLPGTLHWLFYDTMKMNWNPGWTVERYFSFVTQMMLAFGLAAEMPVAVVALVYLGLLSYAFMKATRSYAIVILLVIAMILAPTPDPLTFLALGAPMCLLYEACIWIAWFMEWRRKRPTPALP